jgi:LCP family protein required for cell wall assembly
MRTRVKVRPNLTISLLLTAALVTGCSSPESSSKKTETPSSSGGTSSSAAPHVAVGAGVTVGRVVASERSAAVTGVGEAVQRWIDAAYLEPGALSAAFPGFTARAAKLATRDRAVTTRGGTVDVALVPDKSAIRVDVLGTEGKARAATARVSLALDPAGDDNGPTKIAGRVTLVPHDGSWRIFGYELARQSPGSRTRKVMAGDPGDTGILWILAVGSDARPGQPPLRSRGDALQLVGINPMTGAATTIGIPRDSWVSIPGSGSNRINASLYFGGPKLLGRTVGNLVGVQPDRVFVATFSGLINMVDDIGSIVVQSDIAFSDNPLRPQGFRKGKNRVAGRGALAFSRIRHDLPRGDFQRSAHQQETLRAIQAAIGLGIAKPGFLEKGTFSAYRNLSTGLPIGQLFRIAQTVASIDTRKISGCVVQGSIGNVNGASIVFPNTAAARRYGNDARKDATIRRC